MLLSSIFFFFFFFNDTATTEIYTHSLHDALPIYPIIFPTPFTRDAYRLQSRLSRSVAVRVRQEYGVQVRLNQLFDHHLRDPIAYGGHTQNPFASVLLWNGDGANRWWKVGSRAHPVPDLVEVTLQVGFELLNRLTIHAGRTLAGFDRFIRLVHAPLLDHEGLVCHIRRRHPVSSCCKRHDNLTRPLRSSPITGSSPLLRADPSQSAASVLSPRGFCRLCFSLGISGLVPAVPRKSLCPTHAPFTPVAARPVIRSPAD